MVTHEDIPILKSRGEEYKFLSENRWPNGEVICPSCGGNDIRERGGKYAGSHTYRCRDCEKAKRPNIYFSAVAGTALNAYQLRLETILFISLEMNKGADGLSLEYMSKILKTSIGSIRKACIRLGKLHEDGHSYILGKFAPIYAHRSSVKQQNELKLKSPIESRILRKNYVADHILAPEKSILIERENYVIENKISELGHLYTTDRSLHAQLKNPFSNQARTVIDKMSELDCVEMIKNVLYPNGKMKCPYCSSEKSAKSWRDYRRCTYCKKKYNWKTNTYFMNTRIPIKKCLLIMMKFYHARKSISSHEIGRELAITQRSAYRHMMKLRKCMFIKNISANEKFKGPVQYDEKVIKKSKLMGESMTKEGKRRMYKYEKAVVSVIADMRTGELRHLSVGINDDNKNQIILAWLRANIAPGAVLLMDATTQINSLKREYNMMKVNHSENEYARKSNFQICYEDNGEKCDLLVTNNAIEGFWSRFADQKDVTYQHRFDIKNLPYYLSDTATRLTPGCMLEYGLGVGLSSMISLCRHSREVRDNLHKEYNEKNYFNNMWIQKRRQSSRARQAI